MVVEFVVVVLVVFDAMFDIVLEFIFEIATVLAFFIIAFELFVLFAAPPHAKVSVNSDERVIESNNLFFIY